MSSQKPKRSKEVVNGDIDRLSALPDSVICHILSFLPTKHSVATTILSTRWKNLYTSVPVIDLNDKLLLRTRRSAKTSYDFINFVYKVLLFRNTSALDKFRLRCRHLKDGASSLIYTWVSSVLWRKVRKIDILLYQDLPVKLPPELFSCKSLVTLKLRGCFEIDIHGPVFLPKLEVLVLESVRLCNDDSINKLISGCEVLEKLSLSMCEMDELHLLNISSPSLNNLSITTAHEYCNYSVIIDAPNLRILEYRDCVAEGYQVIKNLDSLFQASIYITFGKGYAEESKLQNYYQLASKFIYEFRNVYSLVLSGESLKALHASDSTLPRFSNLTRMNVGVHHKSGWLMLPELLESSPNVERLSFPEGLLDAFSGEQNFKFCLPKQVPICLSENLLEITFNCFEGVKCEFKLIEYFVRNGQVLEKLSIWTIESLRSSDWLSSVCKKLSKYSKSSKTCQIVLYSDESEYTWSYGSCCIETRIEAV